MYVARYNFSIREYWHKNIRSYFFLLTRVHFLGLFIKKNIKIYNIDFINIYILSSVIYRLGILF